LIYIFGADDRLKLIATNDNTDALPVISATMHEIVNGDYSLDFEVPLDHSKAAQILSGDSAAVQRDNGAWEVFIISEREELKPENTLQISCRHAIRELEDEKLQDVALDRKSATVALTDLVTGTRWTLGAVTDTTINDLTLHNTNKLDYFKKIIEVWGLEVSYSFTITGGQITERKINAAVQIGAWAGRRFEWQSDLIGVTRTIDSSNVKTALIGVGKKPADAEEPQQTATASWNPNLLGQHQQDPLELDDLKGWAYTGSVTEALETDLPTAVTGVAHSFSVIQRDANSSYMVINTAYEKVNIDRLTKYTGSIYVKCNEAKTVAIYMEYYPTSGAAKSTYYKNVTVAANTWTRLDISATSPNVLAKVMLEARVLSTTQNTTKLYWAAAKLEKGNLTPFNNPDLPAPTVADTGEYKDELYFTDVAWTAPTNPVTKPINQNYVEDKTARDLYGYYERGTGTFRHRWGFYVNNDISDPAALLQATWDTLQQVNKPVISYGIKVLDLSALEGKLYKLVYLGDTVAVIDDELQLQTQARCLEIKHDLVQKENSELTLETFQANFTGGGGMTAGSGAVENPVARIEKLEEAVGNAIQRGEIIHTDWLEANMQAVLEGMKGGNSTVTFSNTDGILIEEDPEGKMGGALMLAAGVLALAKEYDFRTGDYIWRTFGTGEGFLSDLVETGFIKWDQAQGGTLTLGGQLVGYEPRTQTTPVTFEGKAAGDTDTTRKITYLTAFTVEDIPTAEVTTADYQGAAINADGLVMSKTIAHSTLFSVRYIRDYENASTANPNNYWNSIKAKAGAIDRAQGKLPTISSGTLTNAANITDGNDTTYGYEASGNGVQKYVQVDLGAIYNDIDTIQVIHYYLDGRTFHGTKTQISTDGVNWTTLYDSAVSGEYVETSAGKTFTKTSPTPVNTRVQYMPYFIVDPVDLVTLEIVIGGKAGSGFALKAFNYVTGWWDDTTTVTFDGAADQNVSLLLPDPANYINADGACRFSILSSAGVGTNASLTLAVDYVALNKTYNLDAIPIYQNGEMNIYDDEGNLVTQLNAETKGFNNLSISQLTDRQWDTNIVMWNKNPVLNYYVDVVNGSDLNKGDDPAKPLRTIQAAIDQIPFINHDWIYIRVVNAGTTFIESIVINGILGSGRIGLEIGRGNVMKGSIGVFKCMNEVNIATIQGTTISTANTHPDRAEIVAQDTLNDAVVYGSTTGFVYIYDIVLNGNDIVNYGWRSNYNSWINNRYNEVYNCNTCAGIVENGSHATVHDCAGSNVKGLVINDGYITGSGRGYYSQTAGKEKETNYGGYCAAVWTYDAGAEKPLYTPKTVTTWTNNDNGAWYSQGGWQSTDLYQGKRPTDVPIWYGAWFFNTRSFAVLKNADGTNRPITKVRISIARYNGYGDNTGRKPHFYYNAATSKGTPSGLLGSFMAAETFTWGQRKWVTLPNSYGEAFRDGKAKTLWLYDGSNTGNYMRMLASATLEITHG
jgi:phage minor structural protein